MYIHPTSKNIIHGAGNRGRTGTIDKDRGILSPVRLPIPPPRRIGSKGGARTHSLSVNSRVLHHWATLEYLCGSYLPPTAIELYSIFFILSRLFNSFHRAFLKPWKKSQLPVSLTDLFSMPCRHFCVKHNFKIISNNWNQREFDSSLMRKSL